MRGSATSLSWVFLERGYAGEVCNEREVCTDDGWFGGWEVGPESLKILGLVGPPAPGLPSSMR